MNDTQPTLAALATNNGLLRHDRAAEAPTDPDRTGEAAPANSPGGQTVGHVMRPPTTTIERSAHLAAAAYLLKQSHNSALVVMTDDTDEPVATITDAEITRAVAEGQDPENTRIGQVARNRPLTVKADLAVADAARLMLSKGVRHLLVVEKRQLVGMVDFADLYGAGPDFAPFAAGTETL